MLNIILQAEFARLSGETKTAYKWRWFLKPLKLSLALLLPTAEHNYSAGSTRHTCHFAKLFSYPTEAKCLVFMIIPGMLADAAEVGLQELTAKMPAPSL